MCTACFQTLEVRQDENIPPYYLRMRGENDTANFIWRLMLIVAWMVTCVSWFCWWQANGVCTKCKQPVPAADGACPVCVFAFGEPGIIREEMFQERVGLWTKRLWSAICKTVKKLGKCAIDFPFHSVMTVLLVMTAMQMYGWTVVEVGWWWR